MHDIRRLGLQVFAAPNNLTGEVQIEVKAREIDFVTSFGKNLQALLDILGITRMIRKENNSVLKTKTVKGEELGGGVTKVNASVITKDNVDEAEFWGNFDLEDGYWSETANTWNTYAIE